MRINLGRVPKISHLSLTQERVKVLRLLLLSAKLTLIDNPLNGEAFLREVDCQVHSSHLLLLLVRELIIWLCSAIVKC